MRSAFASSSDDDDDDWGEVPPRVQRIDWIPTPSPVQRNMSSPVQRRMSSPVQRNSGSSRIADWKLSVPAFDNLDKFEPWKDEQVYGWIIHSTSANKRDGEHEWLNYKCGVHANCSARLKRTIRDDGSVTVHEAGEHSDEILPKKRELTSADVGIVSELLSQGVRPKRIAMDTSAHAVGSLEFKRHLKAIHNLKFRLKKTKQPKVEKR